MIALENDFVRSLPADPSDDRRSRQVAGACYSRVKPTPVRAPALVAWSDEVAALLDFPRADAVPPEVLAALAGNALFAGSEPYAMCYGGHQFGNWAGQLGDGRAINLGERRNARGERWELQLKGAGPTPYSRRADGRAVLRSSVREFLCSEAMHHLGVPTTRALSLVATGDPVERDMFYDGNPRMEPGAIVCRVAPSFLRFGNFELPTSRRELAVLRALADHAIDRLYPELGPPAPDRTARWFREVARRTAVMAAHWMRVGFVHGVMNTDNMSILGLTLDYGPYGWLDNYDPEWTPNTTDAGGRRYCYGRQPEIAQWNLARLAQALAPLVEDVQSLAPGLDTFRDVFNSEYRRMLGEKVGLREVREAEDDVLFEGLLTRLERDEVDMTLFFRGLSGVSTDAAGVTDEALIAPVREAFYAPDAVTPERVAPLAAWLRTWGARVRSEELPREARTAMMRAANPRYVLRNYLAQQAIDAAEQGDYREVATLLDVMRRPYDDQPGREKYAARRPDWARMKPGCSALSCSS